MTFKSGRHFLQIPGPTNVPDRVLRAIDNATIDHRGPAFRDLTLELIPKLKTVFQTEADVVIFPASGTGAWEAALVNTLSPGDKVLMYETGQFATLWSQLASKLGLEVIIEPSDWRGGADATAIEKRLNEDKQHEIKAVAVVHNETSTGATTNVGNIRRAIDNSNHPALFMVDTISSLASIDYQHDNWGVDVTVAGSQKGLMLPPGLSFNAISEKALQASQTATSARSYWSWAEMIEANKKGFFPYTPATNLLYGLSEALDMLLEEGLNNVFARHSRLAEATRQAVRAWSLEILCNNTDEYSDSLTAILMPSSHSADAFRAVVLDNFNMSLGSGLGKVADKVFRIGHLGDFNELMLAGTLSGVEMGLELAGVPHKAGGVTSALNYLTQTSHSKSEMISHNRSAA